MKITSKAKEFIRCVNLLKSVVPIRSPLPSITGILVVKDGPVMIAMNWQSGMSVTLDAEVDLGGVESCIIPGRKVIDICNKIKVDNDDVAILEIGDNNATLKISKSRFTLKTLPLEHFPAFPAVPDTAKHYILGDDLVRLLKNTVYATSGDQSKLYVCGVFLKGSGGRLTAIATDVRRFAVASVPYEGEVTGVLVPTKFARVMISTFQPGDMWLTVADNQLVCGQGDTVITSLLYEDRFPEEGPNKMIELVKAYTKSTTCSKAELVNAVDMALLLGNPVDNKIKLEASDKLNVSASHDAGGADSVVAAEISGSMEPTGIKGTFVKNVLAVLDSESVVMRYDNPGGAFLIHAQDDDSVLGIIAPMRL